MNCANPKCRVGDEYVKGGTLQFVELELSPEERLANADAGFPVCVAPARYFWLCQRCSQSIAIKRWTADGLELEPLSFGRVRSLNLDLLGARVGPKRSLTETNRLLEMLA